MTQASEPRLAPSETTTPVPIRVAIVEDTREVREGLAALINGTRGFSCLNSYYSMEAALAGLSRQQPDVILTDIGLPGMSGIDGIEILRERYPQVPILALTVYDNDEKIFNALCAGASGYLLKNATSASAGIAQRSCRRWRADVSGSRAPGHSIVPRVS